MRSTTIRAAKVLVSLAAVTPAVVLAWKIADGTLRPDPVERLTHNYPGGSGEYRPTATSQVDSIVFISSVTSILSTDHYILWLAIHSPEWGGPNPA